MIPIQAIGRHCPPALGAVRQLRLYVPGQTTNVPAPGCAVYSPAEPESDTVVVVDFDRWSAQHRSQGHIDARPGDWWTHSVEFSMRRQRLELAEWMLAMKNRRFHILLQDWHGERLFLPSMRIRTGRLLEKTFGGKNQLDFYLISRSKHPGTMLAPIPPPAPSQAGWGDPATGEGWGDPSSNTWWG